MNLRLVAISVIVAIGILAGAPRVLAQPSPAKLGILAPTSTRLPQYSALWETLRAHGYEVGANLLVEEKAGAGRTERLDELAAELVRSGGRFGLLGFCALLS